MSDVRYQVSGGQVSPPHLSLPELDAGRGVAVAVEQVVHVVLTPVPGAVVIITSITTSITTTPPTPHHGPGEGDEAEVGGDGAVVGGRGGGVVGERPGEDMSGQHKLNH